MANARVTRGRQTEDLVAQFLNEQFGFEAERRPAGLPGSDIMHIPGLDVEVKARRGLNLTGSLSQQAKRTAESGDAGLLIIRPDGYGPERIKLWPAVMTFDGWCEMFGELLT